MSVELDPREVLQCLNDLGYFNISSKQLKEFLKDLKTLIKHDAKKLTEENQENICPNSNRHYNSPHKTYNSYNSNYEYEIDELKLNRQEVNTEEVFDHLYSTSTVSSRAKTVPKRNNIISIDIRKVKRQSETVTFAKTGSETAKSSSNKVSSYITTSDTNLDTKSNENETNFESKTSKECCCARTEISSKKVNPFKPTVSFIKPRRPIKTCKSDPVSLYQQYQKEWKKQKLPGEDKRFDLRWSIRERMLGEPAIPVHTLEKLSKKSSKT